MKQEDFDKLCDGDRVRYVGSVTGDYGKIYVVRDDQHRDGMPKIANAVYGGASRRMVDCDTWENE